MYYTQLSNGKYVYNVSDDPDVKRLYTEDQIREAAEGGMDVYWRSANITGKVAASVNGWITLVCNETGIIFQCWAGECTAR